MLPAYPPAPWHLTGFDILLMYAEVDDTDHQRAEMIVRALRRESLRRGAKLSAAKSLASLRWFSTGAAQLRVARRLVVEAPGPAAYFWLASSEREAGHVPEATTATRQMLRLAERAGDLDAVADARHLLTGASDALPDSYARRLREATNLKRDGMSAAYAAVRRLKAHASHLGGRATAIECARHLIFVAAAALDRDADVRFARELVEIEASSFSHLALALAHERVGGVDEARAAFAQALRLSRAEGDIHRATKATAGLLRTGGDDLVTKAELRWARPEAQKESEKPPDYRFLRATLGWVGAGGSRGG